MQKAIAASERRVIYGDTDSIFVCTNDWNIANDAERASALVEVVVDTFAGTVLGGIAVKVDGPFDSMCMVTKKCYFYMVNGKVYTKGLDSVRKDYPPITSKLIEVCMYVVNTITDRSVMQEGLTLAIGKVCASIMNGTVFNTNMMAEEKVKGASCYVYLSVPGVMNKVQVENSSRKDDIDLTWVRRRTLDSMASTMIAIGMPDPMSMTMTYGMIRAIDRAG